MMALSCGASCSRAVVERRATTREDHLVGLSVLLVHDHVDNGIYAGGQVQHDVAQNVQLWLVHFGIHYLDQGDRKVAGDKREENGKDL